MSDQITTRIDIWISRRKNTAQHFMIFLVRFAKKDFEKRFDRNFEKRFAKEAFAKMHATSEFLMFFRRNL